MFLLELVKSFLGYLAEVFAAPVIFHVSEEVLLTSYLQSFIDAGDIFGYLIVITFIFSCLLGTYFFLHHAYFRLIGAEDPVRDTDWAKGVKRKFRLTFRSYIEKVKSFIYRK